MYYEYDEDEFEPSEADQEKMAISDSTKVKRKIWNKSRMNIDKNKRKH